MPKINIDQFAIEVMQELDAYREDVQEAVEKAVKETAKQTAAELRTISPEGDTGEYAKHWSYKRDENLSGRHRYDMVVYSQKPEYRLTHLLEKWTRKEEWWKSGRDPAYQNCRKARKGNSTGKDRTIFMTKGEDRSNSGCTGN